MSPLEAVELLTANLGVIDRAVAYATRRYRLDPNDAEDFAAIVKLKLVENDYAIISAYEERSRFSTYISIVVQRMALDFRTHAWGKWHSSAEAKRLGPLAVELERHLVRDGRTIDEALSLLSSRHEGVTRESLQALAARLPQRAPRHREVAIEAAESVAVIRPSAVEEPVLDGERRQQSRRLSEVMADVLARLPEEERLVLQMRFEGGMTVAQIARMLNLDQRLLYRQIERRMRDIKAELIRNGIAPRDALDLIGRDEVLLDFELGKAARRPSKLADETVAHSGGS